MLLPGDLDALVPCAGTRNRGLLADGWTTGPERVACGTLTVKVMTYNVLHFDSDAFGDWAERKLQVAQVRVSRLPEPRARSGSQVGPW